MKNLKFLSMTIFLSALIIFSSCDDTITIHDLDNRVIPEQNVKFGEHLLPVFEMKCNSSGCHNDRDRAGSLAFTSWTNTVVPGIVNPGDTLTSRMIWSITGASVRPMPPLGFPPLTINQIQGIRTWIKEGAKNN